MSEKPISPLRRRMIEDMTVRNFVEKTQQRLYPPRQDLHSLPRPLARHGHGRGSSPLPAAPGRDRRAPADHQRRGGGAAVLLHRHPRPARDGPAPDVRARAAQDPGRPEPRGGGAPAGGGAGAEVQGGAGAAYGAGLRVSEVVALKVTDVDSKRMLLRIEQGKGRKDRFAMLSPQLLELLRDWYRIARPPVWLFPGRDPMLPVTTRQLNRAVHAAAAMAEINKRVTPHTLRHSFATHLLEQNIDIRVIQVLLGHAKLETTALYTQVATNTIRAVMSPLDRLTPLTARGRDQPPA